MKYQQIIDARNYLIESIYNSDVPETNAIDALRLVTQFLIGNNEPPPDRAGRLISDVNETDGIFTFDSQDYGYDVRLWDCVLEEELFFSSPKDLELWINGEYTND